MRRAWIWIGFALLVLGAVGVGFVPDLRLAAELRAARAEGLLKLPPEPTHGAKHAFLNALQANRAAAERIRLHPESRGWAPNASTLRFVADVKAASRLPEGDWSADDPFALPRPPLPRGVLVVGGEADPYVVVAGEEIAARADDEADLIDAARVAHLLDREGNLRAAQLWTGLADTILDRAQSLHVPVARIVRELGPPPDLRTLLQRRFARVVARLERGRAEGKGGVRAGKQAELAYVQAWRAFFRRGKRDVPTAEQTVIDTDVPVQMALSVGAIRTGGPWSDWAGDLARLRARMAR